MAIRVPKRPVWDHICNVNYAKCAAEYVGA